MAIRLKFHIFYAQKKMPIFLLDVVTVRFGVDLQHLVEMDVETQKLKVKAWLNYVRTYFIRGLIRILPLFRKHTIFCMDVMR